MAQWNPLHDLVTLQDRMNRLFEDASQRRGEANPVRAMKTIAVNLAPTLNERSYPIHVGSNLLSQPEFILPHLVQQRVAIISNTTVAPLYMEKLRTKLETKGVASFPIILPDGEEYKNWQTLNLIFDALLANRCERSTAVLALGGGVVGDLTGFAAAINAAKSSAASYPRPPTTATAIPMSAASEVIASLR